MRYCHQYGTYPEIMLRQEAFALSLHWWLTESEKQKSLRSLFFQQSGNLRNKFINLGNKFCDKSPPLLPPELECVHEIRWGGQYCCPIIQSLCAFLTRLLPLMPFFCPLQSILILILNLRILVPGFVPRYLEWRRTWYHEWRRWGTSRYRVLHNLRSLGSLGTKLTILSLGHL